MIRNQSGAIAVINNKNEIQTISDDELPSLSQENLRLATEEDLDKYYKYSAPSHEEAKYGEMGLEAGVAGAARGLTLGLSDQFYTKVLNQSPETLAKLKKYNPTISTVSEIGGTVAGLALPGGAAGLVAKGAKAATTAAELGGLGARVASGAIEGATYGAGELISEEALGSAEINAESILSHVGPGALLGGAIPGGLALGKYGVGAAARGVKKVLPEWTNVIKKVDDFVNDEALKTLKPTPTKIKELRYKNVINDVKTKTREFISKGAYTPEDILTANKPMLEKAGIDLGDSLRLMDSGKTTKIMSEATDNALKKVDDYISSIDKTIADNKAPIKMLQTQRKLWADRFSAGEDNLISLEKLKRDLYTGWKKLEQEKQFTKAARNEKLYHIIEETTEEAAEKIVESNQNLPRDVLKRFIQAKKDFSVHKTIEELAESNIAKHESAATIGLKDVIVGTGGGVGGMVSGAVKSGLSGVGLGSLAYGVPGAVIGGALGLAGSKLTRTYGGAATVKIGDAFLNLIEKEKINSILKIDKSITNFINKVAKTSAITTSIKLEHEKRDERLKRFNKQYELLNELSNDDYLNNRALSVTAPLRNTAPTIASQLSAKTINAVKFLTTKIPKNPHLGTVYEKTWRPSDSDMAKYDRYTRAVENPYSVLDDLSDGKINKESLESLEVVYPEMFAEIQRYFNMHIDKIKDLPYAKRTQISRLLNLPIEPTMKADIARKILMTAATEPTEGATRGVSPKLASNETTETGRLETESE